MRKIVTGALAALLITLGTPGSIGPEPERIFARPQLVNEVARGAERPDREDRVYLGVMTVTAYTAGRESTGKGPGDPGYRITTSGTSVKEGRTCAAPGLPFGTRVYIEDVGVRVVEDRGPQHIDLFMEDVSRALKWGDPKKKVWLIK